MKAKSGALLRLLAAAVLPPYPHPVKVSVGTLTSSAVWHQKAAGPPSWRERLLLCRGRGKSCQQRALTYQAGMRRSSSSHTSHTALLPQHFEGNQCRNVCVLLADFPSEAHLWYPQPKAVYSNIDLMLKTKAALDCTSPSLT